MYSYSLQIILQDELSIIVQTTRCDDCHEVIHVDETIEHSSVCAGGISHSYSIGGSEGGR